MQLITSRRNLLAGLGAAATVAAIPGATHARPRKSFFQRINRPMGLQLYTLGDDPRADLDATFARVAQLGYRDIEMPELYGRTPAEVRAAADRAGLKISSLHLQGEDMYKRGGLSLASETALLADSLGALGASQAVMPIMLFPAGFRVTSLASFGTDMLTALTAAGPDIWKRSAAVLNTAGAALKPLGIGVGYHNHNLEFAPVGSERGWDILLRETDPALVHFEVDVGWVAAAGLDPVRFLQGLRGRARQMHVKDVKPSTGTNFAISMDPAEIGAGKLDWARILPAAHRAGVRHFYVEQEPPFTIPRIEAAARSAAYLARLSA